MHRALFAARTSGRARRGDPMQFLRRGTSPPRAALPPLPRPPIAINCKNNFLYVTSLPLIALSRFTWDEEALRRIEVPSSNFRAAQYYDYY